MTRYTPVLITLLGATLLGCLVRPQFEYEVEPGAPVARFATLALDPRPLVWQVDGQHVVDPWEYREAVVQEFRARGFHPVKADAADLWLDIIAMAPGTGQAQRTVPPPNGGQGRNNVRAGGRSQAADGTTFGAPGGPVGAQPAAYNAIPTQMTVMVKVVSRADEKTLWYGSVTMPANKAGEAGQKQPSDWIHKLLEPLPAREQPVANGQK
jgi:hypothetical protein